MTTTTVKPLSDVGLVFSTDGPLSAGILKLQIHLVLRTLDHCYLVWRGFELVIDTIRHGV